MTSVIQSYRIILAQIFEEIETESKYIVKAAEIITDAVSRNSMVHIIGPGGHSNIAVEEVLWRSGGLAFWNAILDPGTNLIHGAKRSNFIERTPGYALGVLDAYGVGRMQDEVMVIVNAYGINAMTIDTVLECRKRNVYTIGVTSKSFAAEVPLDHPSRHPSGKNLFEEADLFIDNHLPLGDAVIQVEGFEQKICSTSTFCNCFVMNALSAAVVQEMVRRDMEPPVFMSANMPGGDEANRWLEAKYFPIIKHLR